MQPCKVEMTQDNYTTSQNTKQHELYYASATNAGKVRIEPLQRARRRHSSVERIALSTVSRTVRRPLSPPRRLRPPPPPRLRPLTVTYRSRLAAVDLRRPQTPAYDSRRQWPLRGRSGGPTAFRRRLRHIIAARLAGRSYSFDLSLSCRVDRAAPSELVYD